MIGGVARLVATTPRGDPVAVAIWVGVLILVVVGSGLAVLAIRRRLLSKPQDARTTAGSWLDELRAMHRRGEIDDEEFQSARASLLAKISGTPIPKRAPRPDPTSQVARPGFDLTGAPLPRAQTPPEGESDGEGSPPPPAHE